MSQRPSALVAFLALSLALASLAGCAAAPNSSSLPPVNGSPIPAVKATGAVFGGQSPITGSTIQLWAVGSTGYGTGATSLLNSTVTTSDGTGLTNSNANSGNSNNSLVAGSFTLNFTNAYSCPTPSTLVYLTSTGGNPGQTAGTNNSAIVLMAPLGQCGSLTSGTYVVLNEVTTIASTLALFQYMNSSGIIGSPSTATASLASAFAQFNNLVSLSTGTALATDAAGNSVPQSTINTFANTFVPCINSTGPTSSDCSTLFADINPSLSPLTALAGAYVLASAPNANMSPLFSISQANSPFQPALSAAPHNWTVTLGNAAFLCGYSGAGVAVNGTVNYTGVATGRIYLALTNGPCGGGTVGTSIATKGSYSFGGVPPGSYTMFAYMDTQGFGAPNAVNPTGSTSVTVGTSNVGGQNITLVDPSTVTVTSAPTLQTVNPFNNGVLVQFNPVKNNGIESATSYTLQWSTSSSFTTIAGSQTFLAYGTHQNSWLVNGLTNGSVYYFRAYGSTTATPIGPYSTTVGPVTIGAPSTGSTVSGSVTFTGTATGPLYVGVYNQFTSTAYLQYIPTPVSSQAYSVVVPNSANAVYSPVALIDQNNNGIIDTGDITNVNNLSGVSLAVTGPLSNQNITLSSGNSTATATTATYSTGGYDFSLQVRGGLKLPVAVKLLSSSNSDGANVTGPINVAQCGQTGTSCGQGFQLYFSLGGTTAPSVGDTYSFIVNYSDGTSETVTASVTGVLSNFATVVAPITGVTTSTTPTFSWNDPVCTLCSTYVYAFQLSQNSNNYNIWGVPGNANGLPYSATTTSLVWNVDPTDSSNTASVSSLTLNTAYYWDIYTIDSYGNEAITQANYTP